MLGWINFKTFASAPTSISSNYPNICFENELRFHVNQSRLTFWTITELAVGPGRIRPPVDDKHLWVGRLRWQEVSRLEVMFLLRADLKDDKQTWDFVCWGSWKCLWISQMRYQHCFHRSMGIPCLPFNIDWFPFFAKLPTTRQKDFCESEPFNSNKNDQRSWLVRSRYSFRCMTLF